MEDDDALFKITCQYCNVFVTCKGSSGELIYITFLHSGLYTRALYPEYIDCVNFYFQWPARTKIQRMYQKLLKEGNVNKKF